jgi:hypothetical protein
MTDTEFARPHARTGVARRTLVVGAAWSVPVVVGLAAVPAVAASSVNQIEWTTTTLSLSNVPSGIKVYLQAAGVVNVQNPSPTTVVATVTVTNVGDPKDTTTKVFSGQPLIVPAGWGQASNQEQLVIGDLRVDATYAVTVTGAAANANSLPEVTGTITVNQNG